LLGIQVRIDGRRAELAVALPPESDKARRPPFFNEWTDATVADAFEG
jgi:hypothetical protein